MQNIEVQCRRCGHFIEMSVNPEDIKSWRNGGHIQDCMPYLSMDERELLISGICGECFDEMFLEDEEG